MNTIENGDWTELNWKWRFGIGNRLRLKMISILKLKTTLLID